MATIPLPVTRTKIATASWGIPITNEVNTLRTEVDALKTATVVTPWVNMTLSNGWVSMGGGHPPMRYRKTGVDLVTVQFGIKNGTAGAVISTLPSDCRPFYTATVLVRAGGSPPQAICQVNTDGTIVAYYPAGATTDLFAGIITFPLSGS